MCVCVCVSQDLLYVDKSIPQLSLLCWNRQLGFYYFFFLPPFALLDLNGISWHGRVYIAPPNHRRRPPLRKWTLWPFSFFLPSAFFYFNILYHENSFRMENESRQTMLTAGIFGWNVECRRRGNKRCGRADVSSSAATAQESINQRNTQKRKEWCAKVRFDNGSKAFKAKKSSCRSRFSSNCVLSRRYLVCDERPENNNHHHRQFFLIRIDLVVVEKKSFISKFSETKPHAGQHRLIVVTTTKNEVWTGTKMVKPLKLNYYLLIFLGNRFFFCTYL